MASKTKKKKPIKAKDDGFLSKIHIPTNASPFGSWFVFGLLFALLFSGGFAEYHFNEKKEVK